MDQDLSGWHGGWYFWLVNNTDHYSDGSLTKHVRNNRIQYVTRPPPCNTGQDHWPLPGHLLQRPLRTYATDYLAHTPANSPCLYITRAIILQRRIRVQGRISHGVWVSWCFFSSLLQQEVSSRLARKLYITVARRCLNTAPALRQRSCSVEATLCTMWLSVGWF